LRRALLGFAGVASPGTRASARAALDCAQFAATDELTQASPTLRRDALQLRDASSGMGHVKAGPRPARVHVRIEICVPTLLVRASTWGRGRGRCGRAPWPLVLLVALVGPQSQKAEVLPTATLSGLARGSCPSSSDCGDDLAKEGER